MADQIASFFWRLDYIQRFYEGDNTVYNEDGSVIRQYVMTSTL